MLYVPSMVAQDETLERACLRVHEPVLRHAELRVPPELRHAVVARARRRDDLDDEVRPAADEALLLVGRRFVSAPRPPRADRR
jgi:hypothetical protein